MSDKDISITLEFYNSNGTKLGEKTINLKPYGYIQINDVFGSIGQNDISFGYAKVRCESDGAFYFAYASVIDNKSNDPVFVHFEK